MEIEVGTKLLHKASKSESRVCDTGRTLVGCDKIYKMTPGGAWYTYEELLGSFDMILPEPPKREEKYPVGTLLRGNYDKHYYRIDGMKGVAVYDLFDLTANRKALGKDTEDMLDDLWTVVSHAFYVRDGVLRVEPALTGLDGDPLKLSIEKWRVIVEANKRGETVHNENGLITCALCRVYHTDSGCSGCPVAKLVGRDVCHDTPYVWWTRSHSLAAAKAELAFLQELRDGV